ncbi:MAG: hypothetical protein KC619_25375 [Myxococcales bacterium]|nr:hypothetical protein [Myxococcales bacterium]
MRVLALVLVLLCFARPASAQDEPAESPPAADPGPTEAPPDEAVEREAEPPPAEAEPPPAAAEPSPAEAPPPADAEPSPADPEPEPVDDLGAPAEPVPAEEAALPEPSADPLPEEEAGLDADDVPAPRDVVTATPRHLFGRSLGVWLELGWSGAGRGDQRAEFVFSPEVGIRFRPDRGLYVGASFGVTAAATHVMGEVTAAGETTTYDGDAGRFDPGNPTMEVGYSGVVARDIRLELGIGAAVPTAARAQPGADEAGLIDRAASETSQRAAMAMRGYWAPWRWAPERFALFVPARLSALLGELLVEGDLGVGVMVPVLGDTGIDADVIVQLAAGVGGHVAEPLYLGVRLRGVGSALGRTLTGIDVTGAAASEAVVFSAEPWVRLRFDPVQVTLRASVSFNGADGVGGDRAPPFGVFVGVGGEAD